VSTSTSHAHCIKESIRWLFEGEINRMHRYQKKKKKKERIEKKKKK
jgi:hypothetical protein